MSPNVFVEFEHQKLIRLLFRISGVLVIIHLVNYVLGGPSWQMERLFALGEEANIPTWFSSAIWALTALAAYRCSKLAEKLNRTLWILIALGLLAFSVDEVAMIHEHLFAVISRFFPHEFRVQILSSFKATNWPIIASPFLVLTLIWLGLTFRRLLKGSKEAQKLLMLGFAVVVFSGWALEITTNFLNHVDLQWVWELESAIEEAFELIGSIVILSGLFKHYEWLTFKNIVSRLETTSI